MFMEESAVVVQKQKKAQQFTDRLVTILDYDTQSCSMLVEDIRKTKMIVRISQEAIARCAASESKYNPPFFGHLIDERMKKELPVGTRVILERCLYDGNISYAGERVMKITSTRIINSVEQSEDKLFEGILSCNSYDGRVSNVYLWEDTAFTVGSERDDIFKKMLDEIKNSEASGVKGSRLGFMIRLVNDDTYELLDSVYPMDHMTVENVNVCIDSESYKNIVRQYVTYAKQHFGDKSFTVEIMPFISYKASGFSKCFAPKSEYDPIFKLFNRDMILSSDGTMIKGKAWAVYGILQLTGDVANKQTRSFDDRNLAYKLFANGVNGDIRRIVKRPNGGKVIIPSVFKPQ